MFKKEPIISSQSVCMSVSPSACKHEITDERIFTKFRTRDLYENGQVIPYFKMIGKTGVVIVTYTFLVVMIQ
jgi:hypothetical protein